MEGTCIYMYLYMYNEENSPRPTPLHAIVQRIGKGGRLADRRYMYMYLYMYNEENFTQAPPLACNYCHVVIAKNRKGRGG